MGSVALHHRFLGDVAEPAILIERLDAVAIDRLAERRRAVEMKLLDQNAVPGRIVDDVLRGIVLARDVVAVDIARAVGVPDGLAGYGPHGVESELIERAVGVTRRKLRDVAGPVVVGAGDRAVA